MQTTTLLLAALAGSAAATNWRAHPQLKRDMESLQARETGSASADDSSLLGSLEISEECQSAVLDVMGSLPTPGPKIASEEMKNAQTGDPCDFTTPASLSKEYAEYSSEIMSWYSQSESQIMDAFSACSDIADKASDFIAICSTDLPMGAGSKASTDAKETGTQSSSDAKETTTESASNAGETPGSDGDGESAAGRVAVGGLAVAAAAIALL